MIDICKTCTKEFEHNSHAHRKYCHYFVTFGRKIPLGIKWGRLKEVKRDVE